MIKIRKCKENIYKFDGVEFKTHDKGVTYTIELDLNGVYIIRYKKDDSPGSAKYSYKELEKHFVKVENPWIPSKPLECQG